LPDLKNAARGLQDGRPDLIRFAFRSHSIFHCLFLAQAAFPPHVSESSQTLFSRVVEVSSQNGEKPQSSVVPSCSTGIYRTASRTRSRISCGVSTRGSIGETTPMKIRCRERVIACA
jgi:hypothetical protein